MTARKVPKVSETKEGGKNTLDPNLNHLIHGVPACNLGMESKPDLKGRPLGTRTTIEEILDEEFLDSSSLDDDNTDLEDDSCSQTVIRPSTDQA